MKEKINPDAYKYLSPEEVDELYDLTGLIGFHGFSCERWTTHFRKNKKKVLEIKEQSCYPKIGKQ